MTLHGPNNRYINDANVVQALAQFFSRVGIDTKVETLPSNVYFTRATKLEASGAEQCGVWNELFWRTRSSIPDF